MKCHHTYVDYKGKIERVLIPMCMQVIHSNDIEDCTCRNITIRKLEKKEYNEMSQKLQSEIKELEEENKRLNEIVNTLNSKRDTPRK